MLDNCIAKFTCVEVVCHRKKELFDCKPTIDLLNIVLHKIDDRTLKLYGPMHFKQEKKGCYMCIPLTCVLNCCIIRPYFTYICLKIVLYISVSELFYKYYVIKTW